MDANLNFLAGFDRFASWTGFLFAGGERERERNEMSHNVQVDSQ